MRPGQVPWAAAGTHITNDEPVMLRNLNQFTADEFLPFDDAASVRSEAMAHPMLARRLRKLIKCV